MKLKIEVELPIEISKDKKNFIVYNNTAFNQLVGTSAGAGNPHMYKATKDSHSNRWLLPVEEVKKREKELQVNIDSMIDKVNFIKKVLKKVK